MVSYFKPWLPISVGLMPKADVRGRPGTLALSATMAAAEALAMEAGLVGLRRPLDLRVMADDRYGPLPPLMLLLTVVTGLVDAVSYLGLGHVFVANMTGNVVFLGFAVAGAADFSIPASLTALAAFLLGALIGGRLSVALGLHRGRLLAIAVSIKIALVAAAFFLSVSEIELGSEIQRYLLVILLAVAMGVQNAVARRLTVPDLTTTVLTMTLTGLAADSSLAGGNSPNPRRRLLAVSVMFFGAAVGAFVFFRGGIASVLALVLLLLLVAGGIAFRHWSSTAPWTAGS